MPRYKLTVELEFEATAPNSSEAKARMSQDLKIHNILNGADLQNGVMYKRTRILKCKRAEE